MPLKDPSKITPNKKRFLRIPGCLALPGLSGNPSSYPYLEACFKIVLNCLFIAMAVLYFLSLLKASFRL